MYQRVDVKELYERYKKEGIEVLGQKLISERWVKEKSEAHSKFRELFKNVKEMSKESFIPFLYFENNKSWTGLQRMGLKATDDFGKFKNVLAHLIDDSKDVTTRLNDVVEREGTHHVRGMGIALSTAVLHVYNSEKYGVLNNAVWGALEKVNRLPEWKPWRSWGDYYPRLNDALKSLAGELKTDLIGVDGFMYYLNGIEITPEREITRPETIPLEEKVLSPIVARNVGRYLPGLEIFVDEDGREGIKYDMGEAGQADLVCVDKDGNYVVIEFKKGRTSDSVVGQILRYIGWTQENLCDRGQMVKGIIVTGEVDEKLRFATKPLKDLIKLKRYDLGLTLSDA